MGITRKEMDALWTVDGMCYRVRDEFVSDRTRDLRALYARAQKTRIPHDMKRYSAALQESQAADIAAALDIVRAGAVRADGNN